jgi:hypothetical protein
VNQQEIVVQSGSYTDSKYQGENKVEEGKVGKAQCRDFKNE